MSPCCTEKLPRSNFPSRNSFALLTLCKVGRTEEAEWGAPGLRTDRQA